MKRSLRKIFLMVISAICPLLLLAETKKVALIIGNSDYSGKYQDIKQCKQDAISFERVMHNLGFQTILLKDGTRQQMLDSLDKFYVQIEGADVAVFYYSGHGNSIGGSNEYLVPAKTDLDPQQKNTFADRLVRLSSIEDAMRNNNDKLSFMFIDACRNEALSQSINHSNSNSKGGIFNNESMHNSRNGIVLRFYATSPGQVAFSGDGELSPFTQALVNNLPAGGTTFADLWNKEIIREVDNLTDGRQCPYFGSSYVLPPDFSFNPLMPTHMDTVAETNITEDSSTMVVEILPGVELDIDAVLNSADYQIRQLNFRGAADLLKRIPKSHPDYDSIATLVQKYTFYASEQDAGRIVTPQLAKIAASYEYVGSFHDGWVRVGSLDDKQNMRYSFVSRKGERHKCGSGVYWTRDFSDGLTYWQADMGPLQSLCNSQGEVIYKRYNERETRAIGDFSDGMIRYIDRKSMKIGYLNKNGELQIKFSYDDAYPFSEGLALVRKGKRYDYIDKYGKVVIKGIVPPKSDESRRFSEGLAWTLKGNRYRIITKNGYYTAVLDSNLNSVWGSCNIIDVFEFRNGWAKIKLEVDSLGDTKTKYTYVNEDGKYFNNFELYDEASSFNNGVAIVYNESKEMAVVDVNGNIIVPYGKYSEGVKFSDNFALVKIENKYIYIDAFGDVLCSPMELSKAREFSEGFATIHDGTKWGFIDKYGFSTLSVDLSDKLKVANFQVEKPSSFVPYNIFCRMPHTDMVPVTGGSFLMGNGGDIKWGTEDEFPAHHVKLGDFYISKYEVTQQLWEYVMNYSGVCADGKQMCPSLMNWYFGMGGVFAYDTGASFPVCNVTYLEVEEFINRLNRITGLEYQLPTESQWEYAARGGGKSDFIYSGSNNLDSVAWYGKNSDDRIQAVGKKMPNVLGLYDMSGNVAEMCSDWYGPYNDSPQVEPTGPSRGQYKIVRGGNFSEDCDYRDNECRILSRYRGPNYTCRSKLIGFRLICRKTELEAQSADTMDCKSTSELNTIGVRIGVNDCENTIYCVFPELKHTEMVFVRGGKFTMGDSDNDEPEFNDNSKPAHEVVVQDFYIAKYEVTQELWKYVMDYSGACENGEILKPFSYSHFYEEPTWEYGKGAYFPVYNVFLLERVFFERLSKITGVGYRLPTEAEWEYAARGGQKSRGYKYSGSDRLNEVAWAEEYIDAGSVHPVGEKCANELGIYDMSGNIPEMCLDTFTKYESKLRLYPFIKESFGPSVVRGGGWCNYGQTCNVSYRNTEYAYKTVGFRLARDLSSF